MKAKRILSMLLAVALVVSNIPGGLPMAAKAVAETETSAPAVTYTVGDLGVEGAVVVDTLSAALAKIAEQNKQWSANASVEIQIKGDSHSGGPQNGLLFGQTTIWRANGTKLPITIRGIDTETKGDAYIYLDAVGGWYACANDYTFINLTLPIGDHGNEFYAGSGNVVFQDVFFNRQGKPKINNVEEQNKMYSFQLKVAQTICADEDDRIIPDVSNIPVGDAWQWLREYDYEIGDGLAGRNGTYYGDYLHDGDVGGGQYLNACVYFEVLTGMSCVGNTWRPTTYHLDEEFVALLQQAAHETVTAAYGEDFYKTSWTDKVGNDSKMNVLLLGSSNGSYFIDELPMIAKAAGITMTVAHAYYSGLRLNLQWSWIQNGTGSYRTTTIENGVESVVDNQKIGDFLTARPWDAIVTYQTSNAFYDYPLTDENYSKVLSDCDKAYDLYNYMYNYDNGANAGADYYWFQTAAAVIGAPGNSTDTKGRIFGDTCTSAVFSGWEELKPGEKVKTSITFGNNTSYRVNTAAKVAAVGYLQTAPATPFNDTTAAAVTYESLAGYADVADIRPVDVEASIIIDGDYAAVGLLDAKVGFAPSDAVLLFKNGTAYDIYAVESNSAFPDAHYYGDITMELAGGTLMRNVRGVYSVVDGDVSMIFSGLNVNTTINTVASTINGDFLMEVRDGSLDCWAIPGGSAHSTFGAVNGTSTFRWGGGYIKELSFGRNCYIDKLVNEFYCDPNAKIPAAANLAFVLGGSGSCDVEGDICNTFIGAVPSGVLDKISQFGGGNGKHTRIINTVKADAQGNAPVFAAYYGGVASGTVNEIVNNIEAGTFKSFYGGSKIASGTTKITNNISGGEFIGAAALGSAVSGDNIDVSATITGGTFSFDPTEYVPKVGCTTVIANDNGTYTVSDHDYAVVGGTLPTCKEPGRVAYACTKCDATKTVDMPVDSKAHDWDTTDPENYFCKNGCGATSDASHPFETMQQVYCEGCKKLISVNAWTEVQMDSTGHKKLQSGHYYLSGDITSATTSDAVIMLSSSGDNACLHLNGYDITATATRVFFGNGGLNIMGDGVVTGVSTGTLVGGAVHLNGYSEGRATGNIKLYGGVYKATDASAAAVSIGTTGGSVEIHGSAVVYGPLVIRGTLNDATEVANLTVTGGTIKGALRGWTSHNQNISILGGTFEHKAFFTDYAGQDTGDRELSVTGGTFAFDPSAYVDAGYMAVKNENNTYTVIGGHNLTHYPRVEATHRNDGNIEYWHCADCGKYFADITLQKEIQQKDTVITKIPHAYPQTWTNNELQHWNECGCGDKINVADHAYGQWKTVQEASAGLAGQRERTCLTCGYKQTEEIPALFGLVVSKLPNKTIYGIGETLDATGLMLAYYYQDGCVEFIDSGYELSGFDASAVGQKTLTVSWGEYEAAFCVAVVDDTIAVVDDGGNVYADLESALTSCAENSKLTLLKNISGDVSVTKYLYMDLNGHSIDGTVTVADGCVLYGEDAQTDDFTVEDAFGYGRIANVDGKVIAADGYLMVNEDGYSFHRVDLTLTAMSLRAEKVGLYCKSNFGGDEIVAKRVKSFGVALSIIREPNAENLNDICVYSSFSGTKFTAGKNNTDGTSTLLFGIMKEENPYLINKANANAPVYARAYIQLEDGQYVFGKCESRSLRQQVEAVDAIFHTLEDSQRESVIAMYKRFESVMKVWNISSIIAASK